MSDALDRLAPALPWEPDWPEVLARAGESSPHRTRPAFTRRHLLIAVVLLAGALAPLAALAAVNDWWFLASGGPRPVVVKQGSWGGHPWQLGAHGSPTHGGLCVVFVPTGEQVGQGAATNCGPFPGIARSSDAASSGVMTITYLSGSFPDSTGYVVGPVVDAATDVEIRFSTGAVLRVPTFSGPSSLGPVRFYAAELPAGVLALPAQPGARPPIDQLVGLDRHGNVVACLRRGKDGASVYSGCRPSGEVDP